MELCTLGKRHGSFRTNSELVSFTGSEEVVFQQDWQRACLYLVVVPLDTDSGVLGTCQACVQCTR